MKEPLRFSRLKKMARSPAHFQSHVEETATAAMAFGRAVHAHLLEDRPLAVFGGAARRGKAWEAFLSDHSDDIVVTGKEAVSIQGIAESIRKTPAAMRVLEGVREKTILWESHGIRCRATPDVAGAGFITDLKTTTDAHPDRFPWQARRLHYPEQLAFYAAAIEAETGTPPDQHYIVAVEKDAPYAVTVMQMSPAVVEQANKTWRLWMERLRTCLDADSWPGYCQSVVTMEAADSVTLDFSGVESSDVPF